MSLNCSAKTCVHNDKEGKCYARFINVQKRQAGPRDPVKCGSYSREESPDAEFAQDFDFPRYQAESANIKCGAKPCIHHAVNGKCKADDVLISGNPAQCETFEAS